MRFSSFSFFYICGVAWGVVIISRLPETNYVIYAMWVSLFQIGYAI